VLKILQTLPDLCRKGTRARCLWAKATIGDEFAGTAPGFWRGVARIMQALQDIDRRLSALETPRPAPPASTGFFRRRSHQNGTPAC